MRPVGVSDDQTCAGGQRIGRSLQFLVVEISITKQYYDFRCGAAHLEPNGACERGHARVGEHERTSGRTGFDGLTKCLPAREYDAVGRQVHSLAQQDL